MTTSTSFSPINYLIDLDTEYEAMKKAFYQSVAATKAMNAGRINGALSEYEWHPSVFLPNFLWVDLVEPFMTSLLLDNISCIRPISLILSFISLGDIAKVFIVLMIILLNA